MHRRRFLLAAGGSLLGVGVAGCQGDGGTPTTVGGATRAQAASGGSTPTPPLTASGTVSPADSPGTTSQVDTTDTAVDSTTERAGTDSRSPLGVSLSPRSYEGEEFRSFFEAVGDLGDVIRWAGDWAALDDPRGAPRAVVDLARRDDLVPLVEVGVADGEGRLFRPLDRSTRTEYVDSLRRFVEAKRPPHLVLGVEVNRLASADPEGFDGYVDLYARARAAVSAVSPATTVSAGWQLEWLRGRRAGLWGGPGAGDDSAPAQWDLLDRVESDHAVFTSYPHLVFRDPAEIPADYYRSLGERVPEPLSLTEVGWPAALAIDGWESDEAEQRRFVERLPALLAGIDPVFLCWLHLYQQVEAGTFASITLRRPDGTARPALAAWRSMQLSS